jgi:hypothetical protein
MARTSGDVTSASFSADPATCRSPAHQACLCVCVCGCVCVCVCVCGCDVGVCVMCVCARLAASSGCRDEPNGRSHAAPTAVEEASPVAPPDAPQGDPLEPMRGGCSDGASPDALLELAEQCMVRAGRPAGRVPGPPQADACACTQLDLRPELNRLSRAPATAVAWLWRPPSLSDPCGERGAICFAFRAEPHQRAGGQPILFRRWPCWHRCKS